MTISYSGGGRVGCGARAAEAFRGRDRPAGFATAILRMVARRYRGLDDAFRGCRWPRRASAVSIENSLNGDVGKLRRADFGKLIAPQMRLNMINKRQ